MHSLCGLYKQEKPKRLRNESTADLRILGWQLRKLYSEPYNPYLQIVSWLDPFDRKLSYAPRPKHNTPWWIVNSKYVMCCQSGLAAYITIYAKEHWYTPSDLWKAYGATVKQKSLSDVRSSGAHFRKCPFVRPYMVVLNCKKFLSDIFWHELH